MGTHGPDGHRRGKFQRGVRRRRSRDGLTVGIPAFRFLGVGHVMAPAGAEAMSEKGYLALVLHAHLPFVRHPEYEDFLEEDWFFEAVTETYLPLLDMMTRLVTERIHFRLTMSLTPPLCAMMSDPLLQSRYRRYLYKLIELAEKEVHRTLDQPAFHRSAEMY